MNDESKEPQGKDGEPKPQKRKAEDNPWYLLATLYGEPQSMSDPLLKLNRLVWNRYFATNLNDEMRARLVEDKRYTIEELTPLSNPQLKLAKAFQSAARLRRINMLFRRAAPLSTFRTFNSTRVSFLTDTFSPILTPSPTIALFGVRASAAGQISRKRHFLAQLTFRA
jgi:hypothetical protein